MTGAENKPIASRPLEIIGIKIQKLRMENVSKIQTRHSATRMSGIGFMNAVNDQAFNDVNCL